FRRLLRPQPQSPLFPYTTLFRSPEVVLAATQATRIGEMLSRMIAREPLSRIIGKREFWGLDFELSADTLDPRPDSETVIEAVLRSEEHTSELQSRSDLVCRLLLE